MIFFTFIACRILLHFLFFREANGDAVEIRLQFEFTEIYLPKEKIYCCERSFGKNLPFFDNGTQIVVDALWDQIYILHSLKTVVILKMSIA